MKKTMWVVVAALAILAVSWPAKADTTVGGITYSFTNTGMDAPNVYDVTLTMDTSGAVTSGNLGAFSVQFNDATLVAFDLPSDYPNWSAFQQGTSTGPSPTDCQINGSANHWCTEWIGSGAAPGVPDGTLTFNLDVTMPSGTPLPTVAGIQAFQGQGALAISDGSIPYSTPEPGTLALLGIGLVGLLAFSGRKMRLC